MNEQAEIDALKWFHAIDFGNGLRTPGRNVNRAPNLTLFPVMDLLSNVDVGGLDCLDTGLGNGLVSLGLKRRGARSVTATDMGGKAHTVALAERLTGERLDYRGGISFANILDKLPHHNYDLMVCAGVLYHMLNPFDCILKARMLLKNRGILVLETAYYSADEGATIDFTPASGRSEEITTYWMPSKSALIGMLELAGFDILGIRNVVKPDRIAIAARNVQFSHVHGRPETMRRRHEFGIQDPALVASLPETVSPVQWPPATYDATIDWATYEPDFPFQPAH